MAEKKISQLTAKGATVADTDLLVVSESAGGGAYTSKSVTGANIKALVTDANLTTTDITTNNVSTSKHGFAPKAPNDATQFLDGTGAYDTVKDSDLSTSDITTNNVSTTKHGFAPKLPNDATKFLDGTGNYSTPASGGLTKFTEAEATTSPNNTVYVDSLTAAGSTTNVDVAIVPKGTGALLTAIPDNTTTGGNKRGANAVDLQTSRSAATQVASGSASIAIGKNNTASGTQSISIGTSATASNTSIALNSNGSITGSNAVGSGAGSIALNGGTASGSWSFSIGRSTASGVNSFAQGGNYADNTASGDQSVAFGETNISSSYGSASFGLGNTSSSYATFCSGIGSASGSVYGRMCHSSGKVAVAGDSQKSIFTLAQRTTNNTATTLVSYYGAGTTPGTSNQVILSNQSAYRFKGTIIGKKSGTTDTAAWDIDGLIVRGANAAATTLNVSNVTLVQNTPAWGTPTLAADTTNGGLQVQVTGAAATNIQWTAVIETTEVIYA